MATSTALRPSSFKETYVLSSFKTQSRNSKLTRTLTQVGEPIDKTVWGELEPDEEGASPRTLSSLIVELTLLLPESEEEEESEGEEEERRPETPAGGLETPSGLDTPSGFASVASTVPGGIETPDFLDLRKRREGTEVDEAPKSLYQVIPERESRMRGLMGSDRVYDVSGVVGAAAAPPVLGQEERGTKVRSDCSCLVRTGKLTFLSSLLQRKAGGVEISLDANELEGLSEADLRAKYEQAGRKAGTHEDFSDFVGKEVAKRRKTGEFLREGSPWSGADNVTSCSGFEEEGGQGGQGEVQVLGLWACILVRRM